MALTASAVPRVRDDLFRILQLRSAMISTSTCDRPNLKITVRRKQSFAGDINFICDILSRIPGSAIVYVATTGESEKICAAISQKTEDKVKARYYHGKDKMEERDITHHQFLTGVIKVVVATTAFGMGIDKPDIRCVIHYGAPKTFEEYYQHIGRAGRDGLQSECIMVCSDSDFSKYNDDFYLQGLSQDNKEAVMKSTKFLRSFAMEHERCRRKMVLDFFGESSAWGDRCGECDNCGKLAED
eukprot:764149-Hanusia_phi.AAC.3